MTAPLASVTVPVKVPCSSCALSVEQDKDKVIANKRSHEYAEAITVYFREDATNVFGQSIELEE